MLSKASVTIGLIQMMLNNKAEDVNSPISSFYLFIFYHSADESTLEAMFSKKEIKKTTPKSSGLSALMKAAQSVDPNSLNKFSEYEQYDGEVIVVTDIPTRR